MALQNQTFANSGDPYYGNPAEWYKFPSLDDKIMFAGTNAVLEVFPAVPDANTTISFNGNQIAYVSDIPNVSDWAQYPANHNVDIPAPYVLNVSTANISSIVSPVASISTLNVSTLNYPFPLTGNISTLLGPTISVTADQGIFTLSPSDVNIETVNGSYGRISLEANPGQLNTLGGQVNVTANGGNSIGGLFGAINIVANQGTDVTTGITTGGEINITANSGNGLGTATSALNLNSGGINSYAGFGTPIASVYGYNFINGTLGVSLCASVIPNSAFQVPGTCYLYGDSGITLGSDTYATRLFPYWNGLVAPPNLQINGRTTIAGNAYVVMSNVNNISFDALGAGAITGVQTINGSAYPPPAGSVPPDLTLSTITMNPTTGIIFANAITNPNTNGNDLSIAQEGSGSLLISVNPSAGPQIGEIRIAGSGTLSFNEIPSASGLQINSAGDTLTFLPSPSLADQGQIIGLSTINGVAYNPGGGGSYPANANFSTITMGTAGEINFSDATGFIRTSAIYGRNGDDLIIDASVGATLTLTGGAGAGIAQSLIELIPDGSVVINNDTATVPVTDGAGLVVSPEGQNLTFPYNPSVTAPAGQIFNLSTINGAPYSGYNPDPSFSTVTINSAGNITTPIVGGNGGGTDSLQLIAGNIGVASIQSGVSPVNASVVCFPTGDVRFNSISANSGVKINGVGNTMTFPITAGIAQGALVNVSSINAIPYPPPNFVESFQIYVAPNGNNTTGDGSQQNPFLTIAQAITKRATIANTTEVSIMLSSGSYTETFTLVRNTYLVGVQTGEARQPCNIIGNITMSDTTGSMGISGLEITGSVSTLGGGATYTLFGCNITNTATAVNATAGTVFITECRISTSAQSVIISFSTLTIRDCFISTSGVGSCLSLASITTVRQCVLTSTSASTGASALVNYSNTNLITFVLEFCRLEYTNATTDVTGNKSCVRFNGSGPVTASISQCLLICEGAITGSGGQIQCIQKTGAGAVVLAYGQLIAGATANHIAPTIVKTAYNVVP